MGNLTDKFPATSSSNVLEVLTGTCDGRSVTVDSGTYTFGDVTAYQNLSTSYADITGSSIAYTPPTGATHVSYEFNFMFDCVSASGISSFILTVDNTEVNPAYKNFASNYNGSYHHGNFPCSVFYVFDLTAASDDAANGNFNGWASSKTIKVQGRERSGTYQGAVHYVVYGGSVGTATYVQPNLTITAYS